MGKIFISTVPTVTNMYYGYAIAGDGELLAHEFDETLSELFSKLGLSSDNLHWKYAKKYPSGFKIEYVDEGRFKENQDFVKARMRSLHYYNNASI